MRVFLSRRRLSGAVLLASSLVTAYPPVAARAEIASAWVLADPVEAVRDNSESGTVSLVLREFGVCCYPDEVTGPPGRMNAAMAYDAGRMESVLFGGAHRSDLLDDTWTWNGAWTRRTPASAPPARSRAAMAYHADNGRAVLFGGWSAGGVLGDTWVWTGADWVQLFPAVSPSPRSGAAVTYDPVRHEVVLFGGYNGTTYLADTWVWNGTAWTQRFPATSPPVRHSASMAFDGLQAVLYGGVGTLPGWPAPRDDTWTWNGTTWTQRSTTRPPARSEAAMATTELTVDSWERHDVVLFGGTGTAGSRNDTWAWNGTYWQEVKPTTSPTYRYAHVMVYDSVRGVNVLFGGYGGRTVTPVPDSKRLGDTWLYMSTD